MQENKTINIHKLFWYFLIFSILGLIIETMYGFITMGVLESRKGLLWGPFCPVYGVGATLLIIALHKVDTKKIIQLFFFGFLIGSLSEYVISYCLEAIFGTKFWDYSYTNADINGRICVTYSFFWGILAVVLMKWVKPFLDKLIQKISEKYRNKIELAIFIFLVIDALVTVWAIGTYKTRAINQYYQNENTIQEAVQEENISFKQKIENEYFTNERMQKTFPNIRMTNEKGEGLFVRDVLK